MSQEIMQQALDALLHMCNTTKAQNDYNAKIVDKALVTLETALAQPEKEPVAYLCENAVGYKYFRWKKPTSHYKPIALYTAPPNKPWVGLTNEDWENTPDNGKQGCERDAELFDWIEQTLKDKNT